MVDLLVVVSPAHTGSYLNWSRAWASERVSRCRRTHKCMTERWEIVCTVVSHAIMYEVPSGLLRTMDTSGVQIERIIGVD